METKSCGLFSKEPNTSKASSPNRHILGEVTRCSARLRDGDRWRTRARSTCKLFAFRAPGEHLLAKHLVERLVEEVVQGDIGIGADRPVRVAEDILIALPTRRVALWVERLTVALGVFPLDQQQLRAVLNIAKQHGSVGGRGVGAPFTRSTLLALVEVISVANPFESDKPLLGRTIRLDRQHLGYPVARHMLHPSAQQFRLGGKWQQQVYAAYLGRKPMIGVSAANRRSAAFLIAGARFNIRLAGEMRYAALAYP